MLFSLFWGWPVYDRKHVCWKKGPYVCVYIYRCDYQRKFEGTSMLRIFMMAKNVRMKEWIEWIDLNELNWIELNWIELNIIELSWIVEFTWIELTWIWVELTWIELNEWIWKGSLARTLRFHIFHFQILREVSHEMRFWELAVAWHAVFCRTKRVGCSEQFPREAAMRWDQMKLEKIQNSKDMASDWKSRACCCEARQSCLSPVGTAFALPYRL